MTVEDSSGMAGGGGGGGGGAPGALTSSQVLRKKYLFIVTKYLSAKMASLGLGFQGFSLRPVLTSDFH